MFQSTPPHGGRLYFSAYTLSTCLVSIHAPAWGATEGVRFLFPPKGVSIHAPAWGATKLPDVCCCCRSFQSTPPHGGRPTNSLMESFNSGFNPRPRMGGDTTSPPSCLLIYCFNPRPRMGGDELTAALLLGITCFNPRPRMGGDGLCFIPGSREDGFNPRPRMGGDMPVCIDDQVQRVSIHAPAWGATPAGHPLTPANRGFNPRPRMGGDWIIRTTLTPICRFNPRPRMGGD